MDFLVTVLFAFRATTPLLGLQGLATPGTWDSDGAPKVPVHFSLSAAGGARVWVWPQACSLTLRFKQQR